MVTIAKILFLNVLETSVDEMESYQTDEIIVYLNIISYNQFSNNVFNSNFYRIFYIYENYLKKNYDIIESFEKFYGYDLKTYLQFLYIFLLSAMKDFDIKSILNVLKKTDAGLEIIKCFNDHFLDIESQEIKDKITIDTYIPSAILIEKPIIKIDNRYFIINFGYLFDRIYGKFIKKISDSFLEQKKFKKTIYGPLFENYCRDIAKHYVSVSNFRHYNFIDEFNYEYKGNDMKSSDFYISYKDIVIIFEIKCTERYKETTRDLNVVERKKYIEDEIYVKLKKPLIQIEKRLDEIRKLNEYDYPNIPISLIKQAKEFYYIIVSDECVLNNSEMYKKYFSKLHTKYSQNRPIYLNISEYECLMMSLAKRKKPLAPLLRHYYNLYYSSNFYEMIDKERKSFKFDRLDIFDLKLFEKDLKEIFSKSDL